MHLSSSEAALALHARMVMTCLSALAILVSSCTDPTVGSNPDASDDAEGGAEGEAQHTQRSEAAEAGVERADSGPEPAEGGGGPPDPDECEGGVCRSEDAQVPSAPAMLRDAGPSDTGRH